MQAHQKQSKIQALYKDHSMKSQQSLAGYIREHLAAFEARLEVGVRQDVFIEELKEKGYVTTLANFRNMIYRARQRAAISPSKPQAFIQERTSKNQENLTQKNEQKVPDNPLKKSPGFEYRGTHGVDEKNLY